MHVLKQLGFSSELIWGNIAVGVSCALKRKQWRAYNELSSTHIDTHLHFRIKIFEWGVLDYWG